MAASFPPASRNAVVCLMTPMGTAYMLLDEEVLLFVSLEELCKGVVGDLASLRVS